MFAYSGSLLNLPVFDEDGNKLGRVSDFICDTNTSEIQQITVRTTSVLRPLAQELIINHRQIVKIEPDKIIVNNLKIKELSLKDIKLPTLKPLSPSKPGVSGKSF